MEGLRQHLNTLSTDSPEAAIHFLRPAFAYAEPDERNDLARLLLATAQPEAIRLVVARFDSLELDDAVLRALPLESTHIALRGLLTGPDRVLRMNALSFIRRRRIVRDAALLTGESAHAADDAGPRAMTVLALTLEGLGELLEKRPDAAERASLERAAIAVVSLPGAHRLPSVRLALAMLGHQPGSTLRDALEARDSIVAAAMRGVVESADDERVQDLLVPWLGSPVLGRTIARRLSDLATPARMPRIFARSVLLRTPARRAMLHLIERPLRLLPEQLIGDSASVLAASFDLLSGTDLTTRTRSDRLQRLVAAGDEPTAIRAMLALDASGAIERISVGDDTAALAPRMRVHRVLRWRADTTDEASCADLPMSPLNAVRRLRCAARNAEAFWSLWSELSVSARRVAGRAALAGDRIAFIEGMRRALSEWESTEVLPVIDFVRRLSLAGDVELELLALAGSREERLASAAVAAIADSDAPSRPGVVRAAVQRGRGRVRANALRAGLVEMTIWPDADRESDSRTRINTILATDAHPDERLAVVLRDVRVDHRRSALWAAARRGGNQCLVEVKRLAATEPDPLLRERADRVARLLSLRVASSSEATDPSLEEALPC